MIGITGIVTVAVIVNSDGSFNHCDNDLFSDSSDSSDCNNQMDTRISLPDVPKKFVSATSIFSLIFKIFPISDKAYP